MSVGLKSNFLSVSACELIAATFILNSVLLCNRPEALARNELTILVLIDSVANYTLYYQGSKIEQIKF